MKLRGGLWVPDSSDAEVLAAEYNALLSVGFDSGDRSEVGRSGEKLFVKDRRRKVSKSLDDDIALDLAARYIKATMR